MFELVFDRFFFRAAEAEAVDATGREDGRRSTAPAAELDLDDAARSRSPHAIREGDDGAMRDLARLAIAAFGRQGEGSGVIGVDVQRIRRALGLRAEAQPDLPQDDPRREGLTARRAAPLRGPPAPRARARADRAHASACRRRGR